MENLSQISDEELIRNSSYNQDAITYLIIRYTKIIFHKANILSDYCNETEDLMQEGLLGLISAVSTYDFSTGIQFSTYANSCITNRMKNYIKKNNKLKIIDNYVTEKLDTVSPESIVIEREEAEEFVQQIVKKLSKYEWNIFCLFLSGSQYEEIATKLHISIKSVDNAMQRVRLKLKNSWGHKFDLEQ